MPLSRRELLRRGALATGGLAVSPLLVGVPSGCAGVTLNESGETSDQGVHLGLMPSADLERPEDAIHQVLERMDLSWLTGGDTVFVKLACNSGRSHPAVTSPTAVKAMVEALQDRGAGEVLVGDQSGVMSVRLAQGDQRFSSTRNLMDRNGLLEAIESSGATPHFFDERPDGAGFEDGYVKGTLELPDGAGGSFWPHGFHIAKVVTEVDHIVYLPRISSHTLTGYTHGHKLAVGWLRDDSRHDMHWDASSIYEKYTEISYCHEIASRLRLVLSYNEEVLISAGPDEGAISEVDPRVVLASESLADHDVMASVLLGWMQTTKPAHRTTGGVPYGPWSSTTNALLPSAVQANTGIPWTSEAGPLPSMYVPHSFGDGIAADLSLTRAFQILGSVPRTIPVDVVGAEPDSALKATLETHERLSRLV